MIPTKDIMELTDYQRFILGYIHAQIAQFQTPPSYPEIITALSDYAGKAIHFSVVQRILFALRGYHYLSWEQNQPKSIKLWFQEVK